MIEVRFKTVCQGKCHWCQKEKKKVFDVEFSDKSLKGRVCGPCLLNALQFKVGVSDHDEAALPDLLTKEKQ